MQPILRAAQQLRDGTIRTGLAYGDVLIAPKHSSIRSRKDVSLETRLTKKTTLKSPIVSSNMDTVTEARMAIAMARSGGIGILHRFLSVEEQVKMVSDVKRAESFIVEKPYAISPTASISDLRSLMREKGVGSILVTEGGSGTGFCLGIVTTRDLRFKTGSSHRHLTVAEIMTKRERLVTGPEVVTREVAKQLMDDHRIEKLPLLDGNGHVRGLITSKDIEPRPDRGGSDRSVDKKGRLLVGAAIGVKDGDIDRAERLVSAGCDVIVIDVAHGHSDLAIDMTKAVRKVLPTVEIVAGNVATGAGAVALAKAGADSIKVGVGPGSICTTRIVTGCGYPQLSAVGDCALAIQEYNPDITIIADGGITGSGDIVKALAAGADTVMLGNMLAGTDESPGETIYKNGRKVKVIRGMAGIGSVASKREREFGRQSDIFDVVPEGVEGVVNYRGPVDAVLRNLCGGVASGLSYCGVHRIADLRAAAEFVRLTGSGQKESGAHDIGLF